MGNWEKGFDVQRGAAAPYNFRTNFETINAQLLQAPGGVLRHPQHRPVQWGQALQHGPRKPPEFCCRLLRTSAGHKAHQGRPDICKKGRVRHPRRPVTAGRVPEAVGGRPDDDQHAPGPRPQSPWSWTSLAGPCPTRTDPEVRPACGRERCIWGWSIWWGSGA